MNARYVKEGKDGKQIYDLDAVKADFPIELFFEHFLGGQAKPFPGALRYSVCPNCGASSSDSGKCQVKDDSWNCFACREHGDVITAAQFYFNASLPVAIRELTGADLSERREFVRPLRPPAVERDADAIAEVIDLLLKNSQGLSEDVLNYLAGRGFHREFSLEARAKGLVASMPSRPNDAKAFLLKHVGRPLLEKAGMWRKEAGAPALAFRPLLLVSSNRRSIELRLLRAPRPEEQKCIRYGGKSPWIWSGESGRYLLTEGLFDAMAAVVMGTRRTVIALPGCEVWDEEWFSDFQAGADVMTALDPDSAGKRAFQDLGLALTRKIGGPIANYIHKPGCEDLNHELQVRLGLVKPNPVFA